MKFFVTLFIIFSIVVILVAGFPEKTLLPLAETLVTSEAPRKCDAIVVLLGGDSPDRILEAHDLFRLGYATNFIIGSGYKDKEMISKAPQNFIWEEASTKYINGLKSLGVTKEQIIVADTSSGYDTAGELTAIYSEARRKGWKHLLVVTSRYHSGRVKKISNRIAPDLDLTIIAATSSYDSFWWKENRSISTVFYELFANVKEFVRKFVE